MSKKPSYLQIFLNTSEITKLEKVLNWRNSYCFKRQKIICDICKTFTLLEELFNLRVGND